MPKVLTPSSQTRTSGFAVYNLATAVNHVDCFNLGLQYWVAPGPPASAWGSPQNSTNNWIGLPNISLGPNP